MALLPSSKFQELFLFLARIPPPTTNEKDAGVRNAVKRLERLGYKVTVEAA
jgi:hypothetical protein